MVNNELLTKIAEGLYQVASGNKVVGIYREDLKFFDWILEREPNYLNFLNSPFIDFKDKAKSLDDLFSTVLLPEVLLYIKILVRDRIISNFSLIRKEYNRLADDQLNVVEGSIFTPYELPTNTVNQLEKAFGYRLKKKVILKQIIDKGIIAGIRVLVDGVVYEYTVSSTLDKVVSSLEKDTTKEEKNNG